MYDWAHGIEDSIEGITHSICTLEFEDHRPLYDWLLEKLKIYHPKQIEFARFNLNYSIMSKRKLKILVEKNIVSGWDDPRMPTLSGLRRRGYTPNAIKKFVSSSGVVKRDTTSDIALLEYELRQDLNLRANRVMAVLDPIKVIITNYPEDKVEYLVIITLMGSNTAITLFALKFKSCLNSYSSKAISDVVSLFTTPDDETNFLIAFGV
jgi:glutaminyl-tRNA synthetase